MTIATFAPPPIDSAVAREAAAEVWKALSSLLIAPDRARSVKVATGSGKYPRYPVPLTAKLPDRPTAALLFDHDHRARWLGIDLDPEAGDRSMTLAAAAALADLLATAGLHPILDQSPRGGVHLWARLPRPEPVEVVVPLVSGMKEWIKLRFAGVKLDTMPMANPKHGCLSLPGSPCHGGGYRELLTPLHAALAAARTSPTDGATYRLAAALGVTLGDLFAPVVPEPSDDEGAVIGGGPKPLPVRAIDYLRDGYLGDHPTPSEARWSALLLAAWRGWSLSDIREQLHSGHFPGLFDDIHRPHKTGFRLLQQEWKRVLTTVRKALAHPTENHAADLVRRSAHTHDQIHRGAQGHWTNHWLRSAEAWAVNQFSGCRLLSVLAVLNGAAWLALLQDGDDQSSPERIGRYTHGSVARDRVAELPVRSLHLVAGLIGIETIADVLRELNGMAGSPLLLVESGAGTSRGSRYYLHQLQEPSGPHETARRARQATPLAPVWSELGLAAWCVHRVLEDQSVRYSAADLMRLSGLGRTAVYKALRVLQDHDLLICPEPGRYASGDALPEEVARRMGADERYAAALQRIRAERQAWKEILASWALAAKQRASDSFLPDVSGPSEATDVEDADVESAIGPAPWHVLLAQVPPPDPFEHGTVEDLAIELLEAGLGAQRLGP